MKKYLLSMLAVFSIFLFTQTSNAIETEVWYVDAWDNNTPGVPTWVQTNRQTRVFLTPEKPLEFVNATKEMDTWVNTTRMYYIYDEQNDEIESGYQIWSGGDWRLFTRDETTYTIVQGQKVIDKERYFYDMGAGLQEFQYEEYFYDNNGRLAEVKVYFSWEDEFVHFERRVYDYDGHNRLISITYEMYDEDFGYFADNREVYQYDSQDRIVLIQWENFNAVVWQAYEREHYEYDANGNEVLNYSESLDGDVWEITWKYEYIYNQNNQLIESIDYDTEESSALVPTSRTTYAYNAEGKAVHLVLFTMNTMGNWENNARIYLDGYQHLSVSDRNPSIVSELAIYPNPTSDLINVSFEMANPANLNIQLVNETGRVVAVLANNFESAGLKNLNYDLSQFSSGVYFININVGNTNFSQKFVLNK